MVSVVTALSSGSMLAAAATGAACAATVRFLAAPSLSDAHEGGPEFFFLLHVSLLRGEKFGSCACTAKFFFFSGILRETTTGSSAPHGLGDDLSHVAGVTLQWDGRFSGTPPRNGVTDHGPHS